MTKNDYASLAQRLREGVRNPHHVDPLSDEFRSLVNEAIKALGDLSGTDDQEYEIAGYEGSSGLYYSRLAAVANGEQSVEPVYRVKK